MAGAIRRVFYAVRFRAYHKILKVHVMTDKEKNFAILSKLYEFADEIWANVEDKRAGVFTAADIARSIRLKREKIVSFGDSENEQITVEVDSFKCSIPKSRIFEYIRVFERLAGVSSNKAKTFVCEEEKGNVLGSCKFELTKDFADLAKFVSKDELRPSLMNVAINVDLSCLIASDGRVLKAYPVRIIETSGDMSDFQIQGAMFSKLCKRFGARKTYIAECTNYGGSGCIENCVFSCGGLSITTKYSERYHNVKGVIRDVREAGRMILCPDAWKDATKFFKSSEGQTGRSDAKITLHPTVVPLVARKRNTGRFWPLFGRMGAMEATAARRVRAKVLRRRAPTFVAGRVRPPPYYAHNEGRMNSFRFYNNFKISKE